MNERQSVFTDKFKSQALTRLVIILFGRWITFVYVAVFIVSSLEDLIILMYTLTWTF